MKKLSIVVATYNRAPYLLRTLESLARQTLSPGLFEILVVNNNSSDNTPEVVAGFAGSHPQLQVRMVTETSQGISYARNCGIASSVGQYIVFIDDDEEANPEFAKSYFCFFENNPGLDAAGGAVVPVYEAPLPAWYSYYIEKMITGAFDLGDRMVPFRGKRYPGVGNSGFRRRLFDRFGNFNTALGRSGANPMGGEEKDFFMRVLYKSKVIDDIIAGLRAKLADQSLPEEEQATLTHQISVLNQERTLISKKLSRLIV